MIRESVSEGVAVVTLARSERGNALSEPMVEALINVVTAARDNSTLHTLVLTAEGSHFCTGFDLSDLPDSEASHAAIDGPLLWRFVRIEYLLDLLWQLPLRTVAVAQGRAWGAGADLFATCDERWAAPDVQWRFPGAGFGLVLGTRRLSVLVGEDRALRWVSLGAAIATGEALESGLATAPIADVTDWRAALPAPTVDRCTYARLKTATRPDLGALDLAALVRSAAQPGLADRIRHYRSQSRKPTPQRS